MQSFGSTDAQDSGAKLTHLTNLSLQKKHPEFDQRKDETAMTMEMFRDYLIGQGKTSFEDFKVRVTDKINEIMRLIFTQTKDKLDRKFGFIETFGFDFMLDEDLCPILLEINVNPALFLDTTC